MGFPLTARYSRLPIRNHLCCKEITSDELVQVEEQQKPKLLQSGAACGDDDGDSMMKMMIPTLQKPGAREGLGSISSSSWKPGDHLRHSPVVLGVNKAVLWCILSCSQRGKKQGHITTQELEQSCRKHTAGGKYRQRWEQNWRCLWELGCWIITGRCN